jgi:hypothetical protein
MTPALRARTAVVAGLLVSTAALAGCTGGDDEPGAATEQTSAEPGTPTGAGTQATTQPPTDPPTDSPTDSATAEPSTDLGVEPATGKLLTYPNLTLHLPQGWTTMGGTDFAVQAFSGTNDEGSLFISTTEQLQDQPYFVQQALDHYEGNGKVAQGEDREVDGVTWSVVEGKDSIGSWVYELITVHEGWSVNLQWSFRRDTPQARQTVDSVLAGLTYTPAG